MKFRTFKILGLFMGLGLVVFSGCAAVLPAASMATSGFSVFKGVQGTTGGGFEVKFEETSPQDRKALSALESIAIYPGSKSVRLAETLSKAYKIITPALILQTFGYVDFNGLTEREKVQQAGKICKTLKANGLLLYSEKMGVTESNVWTLKRGTYIMKFTVEVFMPGQTVKRQGEIVFQVGAKHPPQEEIDQMVVSAIAERFSG